MVKILIDEKKAKKLGIEIYKWPDPKNPKEFFVQVESERTNRARRIDSSSNKHSDFSIGGLFGKKGISQRDFELYKNIEQIKVNRADRLPDKIYNRVVQFIDEQYQKIAPRIIG